MHPTPSPSASHTTPAEHAAVFEAARAEAARLHHQAVTALFDRIGATVRRAIGATGRAATRPPAASPAPRECNAC